MEDLQRKIEIKDAWCNEILIIAAGYDGCNTVDSLKALIDEIAEHAAKAIACNDTDVVYNDLGGDKYNILMEVIDNENGHY